MIPVVLAFVSDIILHARLQRTFGARLVATASLRELEQTFETRFADLVILQLHGTPGDETALVIKRIFRTRLGGLIAVYADLRSDHPKDLLSLGAAGASRLILRDLDDDPVQLRNIARDAGKLRVEQQLSAFASNLAPSLVNSIVDTCLREGPGVTTAASIASVLGVTRRTLSKRLCQLGVPGVSSVISKTRVLLAVGLLLRGHRPEDVAFRLGFSSASALRNMVRRYTQLRLSELASQGDLAYWCEKLLVPRSSERT